eukprot:2315859-Prymnesium_polylepis.1
MASTQRVSASKRVHADCGFNEAPALKRSKSSVERAAVAAQEGLTARGGGPARRTPIGGIVSREIGPEARPPRSSMMSRSELLRSCGRDLKLASDDIRAAAAVRARASAFKAELMQAELQLQAVRQVQDFSRSKLHSRLGLLKQIPGSSELVRDDDPLASLKAKMSAAESRNSRPAGSVIGSAAGLRYWLEIPYVSWWAWAGPPAGRARQPCALAVPLALPVRSAEVGRLDLAAGGHTRLRNFPRRLRVCTAIRLCPAAAPAGGASWSVEGLSIDKHPAHGTRG